jgi:hypothetical protein
MALRGPPDHELVNLRREFVHLGGAPGRCDLAARGYFTEECIASAGVLSGITPTTIVAWSGPHIVGWTVANG